MTETVMRSRAMGATILPLLLVLLAVGAGYAGGFFASGRTAGVNAGAPLVVFYHPELEKMLGEVKKLGGEVTREIFEFPGGRRFHFREPGGGEFAIWSDK